MKREIHFEIIDYTMVSYKHFSLLTRMNFIAIYCKEKAKENGVVDRRLRPSSYC